MRPICARPCNLASKTPSQTALNGSFQAENADFPLILNKFNM